ncbi:MULTISPECIES: hypothetical protein [Erwinia]|uniref:Uncharacterized protein n=1 Tax=Erwinia billingiae (strain Eb661) TaxID=634500 RepID=D8MTM0_ERWBE|nr:MULTISPECIES: hypothetical protein [Erwinia]MBN7120193.1 hypothetical protein [Erwinia billingiae]MCX0500713.1 hypothetical protein [Erwinia billingiae]PRB60364.1 hypothetical protein CQ001_09400 [Erwinia billingiae]QBR52181.1 hypothetical protein E2F51_20340 [Erwinia sp. QL-Z3]CAX60177.1 Uncharacterized protein EbC_26460 [Erwinia billingiae Eb661]
MSDNTEERKSPTEHVRDVTSQLKEMRHYAQSNVETLSAHWLAFDQGEYKHPEFAERVNDLLTKQGQLLDELDKNIQDMEIEANRIDNEA